jgi:hypothetical protein
VKRNPVSLLSQVELTLRNSSMIETIRLNFKLLSNKKPRVVGREVQAKHPPALGLQVTSQERTSCSGR